MVALFLLQLLLPCVCVHVSVRCQFVGSFVLFSVQIVFFLHRVIRAPCTCRSVVQNLPKMLIHNKLQDKNDNNNRIMISISNRSSDNNTFTADDTSNKYTHTPDVRDFSRGVVFQAECAINVLPGHPRRGP